MSPNFAGTVKNPWFVGGRSVEVRVRHDQHRAQGDAFFTVVEVTPAGDLRVVWIASVIGSVAHARPNKQPGHQGVDGQGASDPHGGTASGRRPTLIAQSSRPM